MTPPRRRAGIARGSGWPGVGDARDRSARRGVRVPAVVVAALVAALAAGCGDPGATDGASGAPTASGSGAGSRPATTAPTTDPVPADSPPAVQSGAGGELRSRAGFVEPPVPADPVVGRVLSVTDGDTLRVEIVVPGPGEGLAVGDRVRFRLLRIDTPEVAREDAPGECHGEAATEFLRELLPEGTLVRGAHDVEQVDQYGRDLVHLWTPAGRWVNGALLEAGLARVVTFRPNDALTSEVEEREAHARVAGIGIWEAATCPA